MLKTFLLASPVLVPSLLTLVGAYESTEPTLIGAYHSIDPTLLGPVTSLSFLQHCQLVHKHGLVFFLLLHALVLV